MIQVKITTDQFIDMVEATCQAGESKRMVIARAIASIAGFDLLAPEAKALGVDCAVIVSAPKSPCPPTVTELARKK